IAIAAETSKSLALDSDGKVYAAGWNEYGQLGLGDNIDRNAFTEVAALKGKKIIAIAAGHRHSLALDSDGKVYATGDNEDGELGLGDKINRDRFTEVSSLKGKKIIAIEAGSFASFALDSDGKVYAIGYNTHGQLGLGDTNYRDRFTEVLSLSGKKIIAIAAETSKSLALDSDGKVYAAGWNKYGQLGLGDNIDRNAFTEVAALKGKRIIAIAAGWRHSLALDSGGKVYATGENEESRLGLGDKINRNEFTEAKF
ncbi:MAG: hypothetical protein LBC09_02550, partial [Helicobacteraceae bacterium]|nr:hypothetical protein [Helicobacteraceae bacterium]